MNWLELVINRTQQNSTVLNCIELSCNVFKRIDCIELYKTVLNWMIWTVGIELFWAVLHYLLESSHDGWFTVFIKFNFLRFYSLSLLNRTFCTLSSFFIRVFQDSVSICPIFHVMYCPIICRHLLFCSSRPIHDTS